MAGTETDRWLNRALLARQGLLEPFDAPVVDVVEAIGALQAQAWTAPPVALWSRMRSFQADRLYEALERRELVTGINLRATLQEIAAFAEAWVADHPGAVADEELEEQRTYKWRPLVRWSALTRVPEDASWTSKTPAALLAAPRLDAPENALELVIRRHLRAFGPASAEDVASWIGWRVPPVRAALKALEAELVTFDGGLYDLPDAPRPEPETPAPARFLAAFDSALLAYPSKRRTRIVPDELRDLVYLRKNLQVKPTFLVDGRVAGIWAIEVKRREATLTLTGAADAGVIEEGERLVRWAHPSAKAHHVVTS